MAETSKKQPRKSKLVPRDYIDLEDDKNASTQMQFQVLEQSSSSSSLLLPKLKTAIDSESHIENSLSPVQFDIQVDVESVIDYDDTMCQELDPEEDTDDFVINDEAIRLNEVIISDDALRNEVEKLLMTNNYCNRVIGVEIRNSWGKIHKPHVPDYYETLIQNVLQEWRIWYTPSKVRTTVLAYKCNICSIGWWHLEPFRQHIKIHKELSLKLESLQQECWVTAVQGQWYEEICLCRIEGHCPKCLKTYEEHSSLKKGSGYYYCTGCNERFSSCYALFVHEGLCARYERIVFRSAIPTESMWRCEICSVRCLTKQRYDQHYLGLHSVRSDLPILFPTLRLCGHCDEMFVLYHVHACTKRMENLKCKYCNRRFLNKLLLDTHVNNTKKSTCCRVCKRYLDSQCMEVEHVFKQHSTSYMCVYKCHDCLDHVLMASEALYRKHRNTWHKKGDRQRRNPRMLVPRSCMSSVWAEGVSVGDMVIEKSSQDSLRGVQDKKDVSSVADVIKRKQEQEAEKTAMDKMCQNLKQKMLKRACSNAALKAAIDIWPETDGLQTKPTSENDELLNALEGLKNDNDSNQDSIVEIKQEYYSDDDVMVTDDDIMETQNSVDALLTGVTIKNEIKIEEQHWDYIVIEDSSDEDEHSQDVKRTANNSQESTYHEENSQVIIKQEKVNHDEGSSDPVKNEKDSEDNGNDLKGGKRTGNLQDNLNNKDKLEKEIDYSESVVDKDTEIKVDLAIVKQEPKTEDDYSLEKRDDYVVENKNIITKENKVENIDIRTEVSIKEEKEDDIEDDEETENYIKREQDACLEELSKVFRATNNASKIELSGISLSEDVNIKEELMDQDDYEDDIIMLYNNTPTFDITDTADVKTDDTEQNSTSDISKDLSSETDLSRFEPEENIGSTPFKKILTRSGKEVIYQDKKTYRCKRCSFVGQHSAFKIHKTTICKVKKHKKSAGKRVHYESLWPVFCTKCSTSFQNLQTYFYHFDKHGLKKGRCPQCSQSFAIHNKADDHLTMHIKKSFVKIQLLKATACISSKVNRLFQCKECQAKVEFKFFFSHWEGHLWLLKKLGQDPKPLVIEETATKEASEEVFASLLTKEQLKALLDQLSQPIEGRAGAKRCALCRRPFARRSDVKRHAIEHLLQDARARRTGLACQLCQHVNNKPETYKSHMRNHAALPVFRCEMCDKCFSDSSNFAKHKKVHNLHVLSICDLCKKKFHSKFQLEKHMEMHRSTEPIPCKRCDMKFYSQSAYKKHQKSRHEKVPVNKLCRICDQRFSSMRDFWTHMWEVHNERSVKADCPICGKSYRKLQDLRAHMRLVHKANMMKVTRDTLIVYDGDKK